MVYKEGLKGFAHWSRLSKIKGVHRILGSSKEILSGCIRILRINNELGIGHKNAENATLIAVRLDIAISAVFAYLSEL